MNLFTHRPFARRHPVLLLSLMLLLTLGGSSQANGAQATLTQRHPIFVGPAAVFLHGNTGTRSWERVEFGTRAVRLIWRVAAGQDACSVTASASRRTGTTLDRDSVQLAAGSQRRITSRMQVEYASARLVIRSDCARWRLAVRPIGDDLPVRLTRVNYGVFGSTAIDIWRSMRTRSSRGWPGYTSWLWTAGCGAIAVTVELPAWQSSARASASLRERWRRYSWALRRHELGHVTLLRQMLARGQGCLEAAGWRDVQSRSDRYDQMTDHGRTQGAYWVY